MPTIERGGATIYYEDHGDPALPALLLLAPGGLNSTIDFWARMPIKPLEVFANDYRIIGMDQRNAGVRSFGPLDTSDPWRMYAEDQLAVLDHLDVDRTLVIGSCIGSSFIFEPAQACPATHHRRCPHAAIGHDDSNDGAFDPTCGGRGRT